jgi:hypothetical protein
MWAWQNIQGQDESRLWHTANGQMLKLAEAAKGDTNFEEG